MSSRDEMWIFQYHPETKRRLMKKARMIVFFDIRGVIMIEWVPEGRTVNQKYKLEAPTEL
jgi:hypothetical protein